jgi:hypothetical protein
MTTPNTQPPCPFCGHADCLKVVDITSEDEGRPFAKAVQCGVCCARGRFCHPIGWTESEQAAWEAWGDRAPREFPEQLASPATPQPAQDEIADANDLAEEFRKWIGDGHWRANDHTWGRFVAQVVLPRTLRAAGEQHDARETRWANDFRRMENRMSRFLERAEKAEKELATVREQRDAVQQKCNWLHGDNEGQLQHYRDQVIKLREERDKAQGDLKDRDNHIAYAYAALGDVNPAIYLFDHIRKLIEERDAYKGRFDHAVISGTKEIEKLREERVQVFNAGSVPPPITDTSHPLIHTSDWVLGFGKDGWSIAQWNIWTDGSFSPAWMDKNEVVDVAMWCALSQPERTESNVEAQPETIPDRFALMKPRMALLRAYRESGKQLEIAFDDYLTWRIARAETALRLFAKYSPLSGDMALLIRASQSGGQETADRADKLVEHYSHLDAAHDAASAVLAPERADPRVKEDRNDFQ